MQGVRFGRCWDCGFVLFLIRSATRVSCPAHRIQPVREAYPNVCRDTTTTTTTTTVVIGFSRSLPVSRSDRSTSSLFLILSLALSPAHNLGAARTVFPLRIKNDARLLRVIHDYSRVCPQRAQHGHVRCSVCIEHFGCAHSCNWGWRRERSGEGVSERVWRRSSGW